MRDMKVGQQSFFYHSNCKVPGIAGLMTVVKEAYPDFTQFDKGKSFNYKMAAGQSRWWLKWQGFDSGSEGPEFKSQCRILNIAGYSRMMTFFFKYGPFPTSFWVYFHIFELQ